MLNAFPWLLIGLIIIGFVILIFRGGSDEIDQWTDPNAEIFKGGTDKYGERK